ncbi:MAG: hypothetical protein ACRDQX_15365, partial [Pseudonocardiaceae bacterium]
LRRVARLRSTSGRTAAAQATTIRRRRITGRPIAARPLSAEGLRLLELEEEVKRLQSIIADRELDAQEPGDAGDAPRGPLDAPISEGTT